MRERIPVEYILPLRWSDDARLEELVAYLHRLDEQVDVTVVDGSPEHLLAVHRERFPLTVRVLTPDPSLGANGKAAAVLTAAPVARHDSVIIADDDVRYTHGQLLQMATRLDRADLVRPQNYFSPLPWHARWDTARSLLNRAFASDYPGTLGVRKHHLVRGYDSGVLFENLELIRTVVARGGVEDRADNLYVRRLPPSARAFASQRVRQAYDSFAQPARYAVELAVVPLALASLRRPAALLGLAALTVGAAALGRQRAGGASAFPASAPWWAPLWVAERGLCAWIALAARLRGGARYRGRRILRAANGRRALARSARGDGHA